MACCMCPPQVRVVGVQYGAWGMQRYGATPRRVEALEHLAGWLRELQRRIAAERHEASRKLLPSAFVTFR
jgi:hypothetical protein